MKLLQAIFILVIVRCHFGNLRFLKPDTAVTFYIYAASPPLMWYHMYVIFIHMSYPFASLEYHIWHIIPTYLAYNRACMDYHHTCMGYICMAYHYTYRTICIVHFWLIITIWPIIINTADIIHTEVFIVNTTVFINNIDFSYHGTYNCVSYQYKSS